MATEDDKTNTGVAGTAIAVGVAAMIAGSTALVGMARTEVDEWSQGTQAYADLASVKALKSEQSQQLSGAKVSIDKARQLTLANLKRDPDQASPWTPKPPPPEASTAASTEAAASATDTMASAPVASQTAASAAAETAPTAAASETAPAPSPTATH
jgi:hypothetical protein